MLLSKYFIPILKENPREAEIVSHRLMLRAGMIRQLGSGNYNWLPFGLRVLKKIENIIREEIDKAGALEVLMPTLQPAEIWKESGRYEDYGKEMLRIKDRHDHDLLYGPTNEEVVTDIIRKNVSSYKSLPLNLYHIQWKFRDEVRPRFGIMRGREFLMKDAYSFDVTQDDSIVSYNKMYEAYIKIFRKIGCHAVPVRADTGPIGGNLSHEFHIVAETGESDLYYDSKFNEISKKQEINLEDFYSLYSAADDMYDPNNCPIPEKNLCVCKGIEVGHIFNFGQKYSSSMNASILDKDGKSIFPFMGSYGIGVSRLVGAIIESSHDDLGIIWPLSVAPFEVGLINVQVGNEESDNFCSNIYNSLLNAGVEILYSDIKESLGKKLNSMDLLGLPYCVIVGPRDLKEGFVEIKVRKTAERIKVSVDSVVDKLISLLKV